MMGEQESKMKIMFILWSIPIGFLMMIFAVRGLKFWDFLPTLSMMYGAYFIIKSKKSESLGPRWKKLGPPADKEQRPYYYFGYVFYLGGFFVLIYRLAVGY